MKKVRVKIAGIVPLLMHKFNVEYNPEAKRRDVQYDSKEDAEKALYKNEKGCYVPGEWISGCLKEIAKEFKGKGKASLKQTILSSVFVEPDEIPLNKDTYDEIDLRPVVIQKNRIVRSRPRFNDWQIEFYIKFDEERISRDTIKNLLTEAGETKGIGDYRPRFGRFKVVEFV